MLDTIGVVDEFLKVGHKVHATSICNKGKTLVHLCFDEMEGAYPFALMVPQSESERLLTEQLQKHGLEIERGIELTSFVQDDHSVTSVLKHADGREEKVQSKFLLGCDGAHSTVRHALGLKFEGETYEEAFASVDCHVDWDKPEDELFGFIHEEGSAFFFPLGNSRYRIVADGPMHTAGEEVDMAYMQELVEKRCLPGIRLRDPIWRTWFVINRRSAKHYRNGRIFIAGDAAHIHSPFMGQGMNTGMQDAFNLSWKLALVEKGAASIELLETYEGERHPVGQLLLRNTHAVTKVVTLRNPVAQELRNKLMPLLSSHDVVQHRAWRTLSMLAVNYRHSKLVGEHRAHPNKSMATSLTDVADWFDFGHGPSPGDRAPDGHVKAVKDTEETRLQRQMSGIKHHLLLFAGLHANHGGGDGMSKAIAEMQSKYADYIECHVIVPESANGLKLPASVNVLVDEDHSVHRSYGAAQECLYLVRPDGYVGFRSQPIDVASLLENISNTFSAMVLANR
jgi:2-polyprenyl-6-methoxyphenol hydroxylase-like FAD-dependent oxidoreductase